MKSCPIRKKGPPMISLVTQGWVWEDQVREAMGAGEGFVPRITGTPQILRIFLGMYSAIFLGEIPVRTVPGTRPKKGMIFDMI